MLCLNLLATWSIWADNSRMEPPTLKSIKTQHYKNNSSNAYTKLAGPNCSVQRNLCSMRSFDTTRSYFTIASLTKKGFWLNFLHKGQIHTCPCVCLMWRDQWSFKKLYVHLKYVLAIHLFWLRTNPWQLCRSHQVSSGQVTSVCVSMQ